jgi:hypothetical protein
MAVRQSNFISRSIAVKRCTSLRHNRADVPRLTLAEIAEQFAKSREQSGLSAHYVSQCRKTVNDLAKAFPGKTLPNLRTVELDAWLGGLTFGAKTKNGMRIILVACGNNLKLWLTPCKETSGPVCLHQRPQMAAARLCEGFVWQENGLRHSFISYRLAVLHDTARVALEAGNSPEVIFGHYRELVTPEAALAWFNVKRI